jgi:Ni,Fe-hydrogenase maturation factor
MPAFYTTEQVSSHGLGVAYSLALAARLNQLTAQVAVYTIEIGQVDPIQAGLSEILSGQLTNYTRALEKVISQACQQ